MWRLLAQSVKSPRLVAVTLVGMKVIILWQIHLMPPIKLNNSQKKFTATLEVSFKTSKNDLICY